MYVLMDGWYDDWKVCGITSDEAQAIAWRDSGRERDFYGPFEDGVTQDD